jgi:RNase P/RNase MRP subunit POP5
MSEASVTDVLQAIKFLRSGMPKAEQSMLRLVLYDENSRRGLLRCSHEQVDEVKASISCGGETGTKMLSFRVLGVSGTIRAAKRKFLVLRRAKD